MAIRPMYIATFDLYNPVLKKDIDFKWVSGQSFKKKIERRDSLKEAISKEYDASKLLEVSTKSDKDIGIKLSALNLKITTKSGNKYTVEYIYQTSKIIENGKFIGYKFGKDEFDKDPYGFFYDYLYMCALLQNEELIDQIKKYNLFVDIEFNPNRSLNTQARAAALFRTLLENDKLDVIKDREEIKTYYKRYMK